MTYAHRLWLMIARRTRHSVSLFLLVFCLSLLGIISSYFGNIVACYQRFVVSDIGYSLKLYRTDGNAIPPNVIQQISHIKGVIGCNQEANMLVQPVNFANAIPDSEDNLFDIPESDMVRLYADSNTALNLSFANHMELVEGMLPADNDAGVIIDTVLAAKNNLGIGNEIVIKNPETGSELSIPIIGIYKAVSLPQESWWGTNGNIEYGQSPYSYLFCTIPTFEALLEKDLPSSAVIVYGKDRKSLDNISDAIEQMGLSPQDYQLLNRTENQIGRGTSASRAISSASAVLSSVTIFVSAFVLLLVVVLWMRACYKDTAILITLGAKRHEIVFDYFLVTSAISVFALLLSLPVCSLIINGYGNRMIEHIFVATGNLSGLEIDNYMTAALNQPLEWTAYLKSQFMLLLVVWAATLIASVNILKNKPAKLFNMS